MVMPFAAAAVQLTSRAGSVGSLNSGARKGGRTGLADLNVRHVDGEAYGSGLPLHGVPHLPGVGGEVRILVVERGTLLHADLAGGRVDGKCAFAASLRSANMSERHRSKDRRRQRVFP